MKRIPEWVDVVLGLLAIVILVSILVTLHGCGGGKHMGPPHAPTTPSAPILTGPPAPPVVIVKTVTVDPLLPLLAWLSWFAVAGMAGSLVGAIFAAVFRSLAIQLFIGCGAVLIFCRTLGPALPWLPWIGLAIVLAYGAAYLIRRYQKTTIAAVDHGEMADDFINGLGRSIIDKTTLNQIQSEWQAAKAYSGAEQAKLGIQKHIKAIIAKVNS